MEFVVTQVAEIVAGRDAQVDFYELEENSVKVKLLNNVFAEQAENSNVTVSTITLHNGFTRNNYRFRLLGEHAEAHIGGLAICDKEQHIDNYAFLEHAVPNCHSNELFKYALQERSTGVFCGRILVDKGRRKRWLTEQQNLIASGRGQDLLKPQLEIYADDVKCSHGLTTGQIDQDALFYLQARGIPEEEARMLLMVATQDVVDLVRIEMLQDRLIPADQQAFQG